MSNPFIELEAEDLNGKSLKMDIPTDMGLSIMEVLKGEGFPILATCGGMALCATCHIEVLEGFEDLPEPSNEELDMLESLPILTRTSRLSCQLRPEHCPSKIKVRVLGEDNV